MRLSSKDFLDFCEGKAGEDIKTRIAGELVMVSQGSEIKRVIKDAAADYLESSLRQRTHDLRIGLTRVVRDFMENLPEAEKQLIFDNALASRYTAHTIDSRINAAIDRSVNAFLVANPHLIKELIAAKLGLQNA